MSFQFSENSLKILATVDLSLQNVLKIAIKESPIDFGIPSTGGKRSAELQNKLFLDKKSKADGYTKKSFHQTGRAIDVYAYVNGKASWDRAHLTSIANIIKKVAERIGVELTWGGDWTSFIDMPHYQLNSND